MSDSESGQILYQFRQLNQCQIRKKLIQIKLNIESNSESEQILNH